MTLMVPQTSKKVLKMVPEGKGDPDEKEDFYTW